MPVKPRGKSWQASVCVRGQRDRADFKTKEEAELWEAQTKAAMLAGTWKKGGAAEAEDKSPTLGEFLDVVIEARWKGKKSAATLIKNAQQVVAIIGPARLVSTLTKADADLVRNTFRKRGRSDATINRKLASLSVIVNEAVERELLLRGFSVGITKERTGRIRYLSKAEQDAALKWCRATANDDLYDYIIVSLDTGFRQGEVLKIEARDTGKPELWTYDTKSGKNRAVPLTERCAGVLSRRAKFLRPDDRLFQMHPDRLRDKWRQMQTYLKLQEDDQFIPHAMRHTFVTEMLFSGVDIRTVMELAGHSRIETTQRYAQTSPERLRLAIARRTEYQAA